MEQPSSHRRIYLPILYAFLILSGIFIGTRLNTGRSASGLLGTSGKHQKINDLIYYIEANYVDTVGGSSLYDAAVSGLLKSLDPHSQYIPAADFHAVMDPLRGNFEGIGIQFRVIKDTVVVLQTIKGGPSEKAGLQPGDRLVSINGKTVAGKKMADADIIKQLKGDKGSQVQVGIFRRGSKNLLPFTLTRDVIPTYSIESAYMITPTTGYIKLSKFSATTTQEVTEALVRLRGQGMEKLILDLRDNTGGYLQAAIELAEEFLPEKQMIVYTEGRKRPRKNYVSGGNGKFQNGELVILIDEGSASASEILAGAVQDNDRGTIVGRRSFGKGLVQEELDFKDGSAVRLTVARYYTPTGRCIQKPYDQDHKAYSLEAAHRFSSGEILHPDSIQFADSLKYTTPKGKVVYGGGGIMPDVYVVPQYNEHLTYLNALINKGIMYQFAFDYTDTHRGDLARFKAWEAFNTTFRIQDQVLEQLFAYAEGEGVKRDNTAIQHTKDDLRSYCKSMIARVLFRDEGFYPIQNQEDASVKKALEILSPHK